MYSVSLWICIHVCVYIIVYITYRVCVYIKCVYVYTRGRRWRFEMMYTLIFDWNTNGERWRCWSRMELMYWASFFKHIRLLLYEPFMKLDCWTAFFYIYINSRTSHLTWLLVDLTSQPSWPVDSQSSERATKTISSFPVNPSSSTARLVATSWAKWQPWYILSSHINCASKDQSKVIMHILLGGLILLSFSKAVLWVALLCLGDKEFD